MTPLTTPSPTQTQDWKKEFDKKFELYEEIYNKDWIKYREEKYINVSANKKVKDFILHLLTTAVNQAREEERERIVRLIGWMKRTNPNPLKMDIVHSRTEWKEMRNNKMFNSALSFIESEISSITNKTK